ncbi:hypothetical protein SLEP1_g49863 [Rubroshorea leprosula]|uniref:Uncharacterized protein n=1 Tax=Rubroshorea leprosula TaxID=152421 RepID=A0AAV5M1G7_9ROSI|nr:hypothetical protein SLEP1_g49863 [Rubroshorea leprosula]
MLRKALFSFEKYLQQVHFKCQRHSQMKELESIHQVNRRFPRKTGLLAEAKCKKAIYTL